MSEFDYTRPLATAQRLIKRFGRSISLQGVSTELANPSNPLAGPVAPPPPIVGIPATFVPPSSLQVLGFSARMTELFANCEQICIVAPIDNTDFSSMKFLYDSGKRWKISLIEKLKPGDLTVLYFIGINSP